MRAALRQSRRGWYAYLMRATAILVLLLAAGAAPSRADPATMTLEQFVVAADRAEPLGRAELERMLGRSLVCDTRFARLDCEARDVAFADRTVGRISLRGGEAPGSILMLENFAGPCLPPEPLRSRFRLDRIENSCTDGKTCIYLSGKRRWGDMALGVEGQPQDACIIDIVLNSLPG